MGETLIVIGGTAAGLSAASKAKRLNPNIQIKVYEKSGYISYGACGLPYFVGDIIKEPDDLISVSVKDMNEKRNIETHIYHEVTRIDRDKKEVEVLDLETQKSRICKYDKLVIATGARPVKPDIQGMESKNVFYLRTVEDGIRLKAAAMRTGVKSAAIIGGGFIGLEMAEELKQSGLDVDIYEGMPRLLPFLDESFSTMVLQTLVSNQVNVHLGASVAKLMTNADIILISAGVEPESALAKKAGLKLGLKGGIVVDDTLQTSDEHIWACGDCVQMKHMVSQTPVYIPLGTTANKQGRIAGENIAGKHSTFKGVLGSMVTKVFDLYIAATGLNEEQAKKAGFAAVSSMITKRDRASYYPGGEDSSLNLIFDAQTGRLLGAQGVGGESIAGRINVLAAAITCGMTVSQVSELDLVYAPPVAPVYDPILIAATQAIKKLEK